MTVLEQLINADGISGNEMDVRKIIDKEIKRYVSETRVDKIGNLIAHKKGKKPTVMLAAHMDEVGLMIKHIENDGRIYFSAVGDLDAPLLIGQRVKIEKIRGVITTEGISKGESLEEMPALDKLYVDTGLTKKELKKKGVKIGSYISFDQCAFCSLGSGKIISGKALDDRTGCYILVELAKRLKNVKNEIYYVMYWQFPDYHYWGTIEKLVKQGKFQTYQPAFMIKNLENLLLIETDSKLNALSASMLQSTFFSKESLTFNLISSLNSNGKHVKVIARGEDIPKITTDTSLASAEKSDVNIYVKGIKAINRHDLLVLHFSDFDEMYARYSMNPPEDIASKIMRRTDKWLSLFWQQSIDGKVLLVIGNDGKKPIEMNLEGHAAEWKRANMPIGFIKLPK